MLGRDNTDRLAAQRQREILKLFRETCEISAHVIKERPAKETVEVFGIAKFIYQPVISRKMIKKCYSHMSVAHKAIDDVKPDITKAALYLGPALYAIRQKHNQAFLQKQSEEREDKRTEWCLDKYRFALYHEALFQIKDLIIQANVSTFPNVNEYHDCLKERLDAQSKLTLDAMKAELKTALLEETGNKNAEETSDENIDAESIANEMIEKIKTFHNDIVKIILAHVTRNFAESYYDMTARVRGLKRKCDLNQADYHARMQAYTDSIQQATDDFRRLASAHLTEDEVTAIIDSQIGHLSLQKDNIGENQIIRAALRKFSEVVDELDASQKNQWIDFIKTLIQHGALLSQDNGFDAQLAQYFTPSIVWEFKELQARNIVMHTAKLEAQRRHLLIECQKQNARSGNMFWSLFNNIPVPIFNRSASVARHTRDLNQAILLLAASQLDLNETRTVRNLLFITSAAKSQGYDTSDLTRGLPQIESADKELRSVRIV